MNRLSRLSACHSIALLLATASQADAAPTRVSADIRITQFNHASWTEKSGAPTGVSALAQDADGYLWMGADGGVFRFDGRAFEHVTKIGDQALPNLAASQISVGADGGMWIGYRRDGLFHVKDGQLRHIALGAQKTSVSRITIDARGITWVVANGHLWRVEHLQATRVDEQLKPTAKMVDLALDATGALWVKTEAADGLFCLPAGAQQFTPFTAAPTGALYATPGWLWLVGDTTLSRLPAENCRATNPTAKWETVTIPEAGLALVAPDGAAWSTSLDGIARDPSFEALFDKHARHAADEQFTPTQGLSSAVIRAYFADRDGNIWVGTDAGLDRFRRTLFTPITLPGRPTGAAMAPAEGGDIWAAAYDGPLLKVGSHGIERFPSVGPRVFNLYRDRHGALWAGGDNLKTWRSDEGGFTALPRLPAPDAIVNALAVDDAGVLWAGLESDTATYRFNRGSWSRSPPGDGATHPHGIDAIVVDQAGRVWQSYGDAIVVTDADGAHAMPDLPSIGAVYALYSHGHHMWLGGSDGIALFDGQRFVRIDARDGKPFSKVDGIVERANGDVWLREKRDALRIRASDLAARGSAARIVVDVERFDATDGLGVSNYSQRPGVIEADDGKLWFNTDDGLAWLDPAAQRSAPRPAQVRILALDADGKSYSTSGHPVLDERNQHTEMAFTAIDLSTPETTRFRYRLDGIDADWRSSGNSRAAQFNNLPPGEYVFHVRATDERGAWRDDGADLAFTVRAAWFQTWTFRLGCALLAGFAAWRLHRWRANHLTRQALSREETRQHERNRIARDLHDTLLQGTQGLVLNLQVVAGQLPQDDSRRQRLQALLDGADNLIAEARDRVHCLRGAEGSGEHALMNLVEFGRELEAATGIAFRAHLPAELPPLPDAVGCELFLLGREALSNAFRHARARTVELTLAVDGRSVSMSVADDGIGIDAEILAAAGRPGHWGLMGMRERALTLGARLEVSSNAARGTRIALRIRRAVRRGSAGAALGWRGGALSAKLRAARGG